MKQNSTELLPIDLVYLWVDGNDPAWRAKRDKTIGRTEERSAVNCDGRYASHDELLYSLRSAEQYAPWLRRIYIVTDGQIPAWLDTTNPKVRIVDHKEIMPAEALPCFNSSVIEHFLWRIPGLSERFLYANDDMYFGRPVEPGDFFAPDGMPYIRENRRPLRRQLLWLKSRLSGKKMSHYNRIVQNGAELVRARYGKYYGAKAHHNIDAYLRSDCEATFNEFIDSLQPTFANHVRQDNDVQRSLYSYAAMARQRAHPLYVDQHTSLRVHIQNPRHYDKLRTYTPMFFCMNDSEYATEADRLHSKEYLAERFPQKSKFEK
ncbi:MAG: Stealth CR1 domain-containing protein [Muribaculaceae bacterium]|nr:Stealth CR1 domain-containing protein [Muribaculaceae bacterium]